MLEDVGHESRVITSHQSSLKNLKKSYCLFCRSGAFIFEEKLRTADCYNISQTSNHSTVWVDCVDSVNKGISYFTVVVCD